jgi:hypothetical protein
MVQACLKVPAPQQADAKYSLRNARAATGQELRAILVLRSSAAREHS